MAKQQTEKANPFKKRTLNLPFHKFDDNDTLNCIVLDRMKLGEEKPFDVYRVVDVESGEEKFVTSSYAIHKCVQDATLEYQEKNIEQQDIVFNIVFKGKTEINGKPFNQFDISDCSMEDYKKFMGK